jgi:hypothetical protein
MVCLRTFSTPQAHTYGYNLGFLRSIGFSVGGGGGRGVVEKKICLMLHTCYCYQLRHPQMLGNPENTFKSRYEGCIVQADSGTDSASENWRPTPRRLQAGWDRKVKPY